MHKRIRKGTLDAFRTTECVTQSLVVFGVRHAVQLKLPVRSTAFFIQRDIEARDQLGNW